MRSQETMVCCFLKNKCFVSSCHKVEIEDARIKIIHLDL